MAFVNDFGKGADFVGFKAEIKGFVGGVPVTDDAEAFEVATLQLDLFGSVFTAFLAELDGIQGNADFAVFFQWQFQSASRGNPSLGCRVRQSRLGVWI